MHTVDVLCEKPLLLPLPLPPSRQGVSKRPDSLCNLLPKFLDSYIGCRCHDGTQTIPDKRPAILRHFVPLIEHLR